MSTEDLRLIPWEEATADLADRLPAQTIQQIRADLRGQLRDVLVGDPIQERIKVDRYTLRSALACPASAAPTEFRPNAIITSKALGLRALELTRADPDPAACVARAIDEAVTTRRWMADFLDGQGEAARATTVAFALSWLNRALTHVPWTELGRVTFLHLATWHSPLGYGSGVALVGRPDAFLTPGDTSTRDRVALSFGWPDSDAAALDALVVALDTGSAPRRCLISYAPAGTVHAIDVTKEVLATAVTNVVTAVAALVPSARGERPYALPNSRCWNCAHSDGCAEGQTWMAEQPRRRSGLLIQAF